MREVTRFVKANRVGLAKDGHSRPPLLIAFVEITTKCVVVQCVELLRHPPQIAGSVVGRIAVDVVDDVEKVRAWVMNKSARAESVHQFIIPLAPVWFFHGYS